MSLDVRNIRFEQHFVTENSQVLKDIIKPLNKFGVTDLHHYRIYKNNTGVSFSTFPDFRDVFVEHKLWCYGCVGSYDDYDDSYFFCDDLDSKIIFQAISQHNKIGNGFNVIKKHDDYVDNFYFLADISNINIKHFFLNHRDIIDKFINYYYQAARNILNQGPKHAYFYPSNSRESTQIVEYSKVKKHYLQTKQLFNGLFISANDMHLLSQRELDVIKSIGQGFSAKVASDKLNISVKTVERHLENARKKMGVKNTLELCIIVLSNNS